MTNEEAAARLDGNEYRKEGSPALWAEMKAAGLVAVFGASDDLMEFRGAIEDEVGAWEGAEAHVTPAGLVTNECDNGQCPYHKRALTDAVKIEAIWDRDGFAWVYETSISHAQFRILEDGEPYCRGIVFALSDADPAPGRGGRGRGAT